MANIFFTADTHFGHALMTAESRRCPRPWATAEEMTEALIANWNATVGEKDIVYHLGDVSFLKAGQTFDVLRRLNGFKHLVRGNHDNLNQQNLAEFESVADLKEIKVEGQRIVLCHYALMTWNKMHNGSWMLHGHSHGALKVDETKCRMDVGVDARALPGRPETYRPIPFEHIKLVMDAKQPFVPVDHHGTDKYEG